jgi:predicted flap endonuclease-1-like 5' DNA nuclease
VEAVVSSSQKKAADDLVKIEGIGPKVVKVLARAGIETFDDLAEAKRADVQKVLDQAGLQMMDPDGWIDQAKLAAKGDWAGFEKLQTKLKGGRKK